MKKQYLKMVGLDCANCAQKIEDKLNSFEFVCKASVNFALSEMEIVFEEEAADNAMVLIEKAIKKIEPEVKLFAVSKQVLETPVQQKAPVKNQPIPQDTDVDEAEELKQKITHFVQSKKDIFNIEMALLALAAALFAGSFFFKAGSLINFTLIMLSIALSGYKIFMSAIKGLSHLSFNENVLVFIAVVAAVAIGEYMEGALVVILFAIGEMLEDYAVGRSRRNIQQLLDICPDMANIVVDDDFKTVPAESVQVGDTIIVKKGEKIPLDCIILSGTGQIDNSALTGESIPVTAEPGTNLLSGGINMGEALRCRVTNNFQNSAAAKIVQLVRDAQQKKSKQENFIGKFAKIYTPCIIIAALLLFVVSSAINPAQWMQWLKRSLVFLVASCPCALVISVPLGFFSSMGALSRKGILVKGGKYVEALSHAKAVVFDKTGTLTTGLLKVSEVVCFTSITQKEMLLLAAACEKLSNHPIAQAISIANPDAKAEDITGFEEIEAVGIKAVYQNREIVCGGKRIFESFGIENTHPEAVANVFVAIDGVLQGYINVSDSVREEAPAVMKQLKSLGVEKTALLTGDAQKAAEAARSQCGIDEAFASLLPEEKVAHMQQIKEKHVPALFVGDGINDAPVITAADVGVAMGLGTSAAIEAADVVLVRNELASLPKAIGLCRSSMNIIRFNIIFALIIKAAVLILGALGIADMAMAIFADVGVTILAVLNSARILKKEN